MKTVRVGGPLLGRRKSSPSARNEDPRLASLSSHATLEPIITPPLSNFSKQEEQFVILPSVHHITVLSYKTGQRVATLVPRIKSKSDTEDDEVVIESVCLATFGRNEKGSVTADLLTRAQDDDSISSSPSDENSLSHAHGEADDHVLLVGCRDGSLYEFALQALAYPDRAENSIDCGPYELMGPCHRPRRVFRLTEKKCSVRHLTAPRVQEHGTDGVLVFALSETRRPSATGAPSSKAMFALLRVELPAFDSTIDVNQATELFKDSTRVQVKDTLKCRVGRDKKGHHEDSTPFRLLSTVMEDTKTTQFSHNAGHDLFVVVARCTTFHVYHERLASRHGSESDSSAIRSVSFTVAPPNMLSALCISPNGVDVTCGYHEGDIRVMSNLLPRTLEYMDASERKTSQGPAPRHPSKTVLVRRVHWHAHPVSTLAYHGKSGMIDPMLYSGGEESVLVTWQLSRGSYRPADVLPRLAMGGIVHICCGDGTREGGAMGILIYSEDNSLQLFESHNRSLLWKVQGLAGSGANFSRGNATQTRTQTTSIRSPTTTASPKTVLLSGLAGAPGYLHWFNYQEQRVVRQLEVAPYNRVSRTEKDEEEMPAPSISHCVISDNDQDLLTVDTSPTENEFVGAAARTTARQTVGIVSTLRFWTRSPESSKSPKADGAPYSLTAAMANPHGEENRVSAVAISRDGQYACTASNDENAFRVWHHVQPPQEDDERQSRRAPLWVCQFKVTTPAGYSNFPTGCEAIDFSADGTILSIAYGNMITIWDYKETSLLKSLRHLDYGGSPVDELRFIKTDFLHDLILTKSSTGVKLQSPYGNRGQASWACALPASYKDMYVSHVELIPCDNNVVICMVSPKERHSRILLVDATTGCAVTQGNEGSTKPVVWEIHDIVRAMGCRGDARKQSNWVQVGSLGSIVPKNQTMASVFVMTASGDMLLLQQTDKELAHVQPLSSAPYGSITAVPKLNMLRRQDDKKRVRVDRSALMRDEPSAKAARAFGSLLGSDDSDRDGSGPLQSSELPVLSGMFTRAYVGQGLAKRRRGEAE